MHTPTPGKSSVLGMGSSSHKPHAKCQVTSPYCTAAATLCFCRSPSTFCQAFNHSLAAGKLPIKRASDQAGRKVLECEGSRRQAGINNFQSQVFLPDSGSVSVCLVVSLALPDGKSTVAKGKELLPHLISSAQCRAGIWVAYSFTPSYTLAVAASQLYVHLQLTFLTTPSQAPPPPPRISTLPAFCTIKHFPKCL